MLKMSLIFENAHSPQNLFFLYLFKVVDRMVVAGFVHYIPIFFEIPKIYFTQSSLHASFSITSYSVNLFQTIYPEKKLGSKLHDETVNNMQKYY